MTDKLKSGNATPQDIDGINDKINAAQQGSAKAGITVPDQVPSAAQLANPS